VGNYRLRPVAAPAIWDFIHLCTGLSLPPNLWTCICILGCLHPYLNNTGILQLAVSACLPFQFVYYSSDLGKLLKHCHEQQEDQLFPSHHTKDYLLQPGYVLHDLTTIHWAQVCAHYCKNVDKFMKEHKSGYAMLQWGFLVSCLVQEYTLALWCQAILCGPSCKFFEGHTQVEVGGNSNYVVQGVPNTVQDILYGKLVDIWNKHVLYLWPPAAVWESCGCATIGVWLHFSKKWFWEQAAAIADHSAIGLTKEEWMMHIWPLPMDRRLLKATCELIDSILHSKHIEQILQAHGWTDLRCCNNLLTLANAA
jgi:hypothetical protein